uniref:G-protein coupled receptors family 1 profile domain-containing protein n=1 Tax=Plectus sambesii TaxID=2011161 RepID=A0A914VAY6_9BILA
MSADDDDADADSFSISSSDWLLFFFSSLYIIVPLLGITLNSYVLLRLRRIARESVFRFETTSALPLTAMSMADTICLCAELFQVLFHYSVKLGVGESLDPRMLAWFCKIDLYLMHVTSAFSVWCWLVLSVMRYVAVFKPFIYRTIWRQPRHALIIIAGMSGTFQIWILGFVTYNAMERGCIEDERSSLISIKVTHMADITASYVVPALLTATVDAFVFCRRHGDMELIEPPQMERRLGIALPGELKRALIKQSGNSSPTTMCRSNRAMSIISTSSNQVKKRLKASKKRQSMMYRSLLISLINLSCNLPSHMLRAIWTLEVDLSFIPGIGMRYIEGISQLLYFAQFGCNAFYLSTTIYETSAPSRPPLVKQNNSERRSSFTV